MRLGFRSWSLFNSPCRHLPTGKRSTAIDAIARQVPMIISIVVSSSSYPFTASHKVTPFSQSDASSDLALCGPASARERTSTSCLCLSILAHHHQSTTTLPHTNTSLHALQPTQLLLPLLQSPGNPLFPQPSGLADHRSIACRPTTIAAHCLCLLIPPAIDAVGTSHEHTIY